MDNMNEPAREHRRAHHHDFLNSNGEFTEGRRAMRAGRGHGYGPAGPGFGPPPGFGPGPKRGPRGSRERGDVRTAVLVLLAERPRHGYDLMRAIEERTDGAWSPSPGSIYPTLQALEDEGLVTFETVDGRKTATLTDDGRAWVGEHANEAEAVFARGGDRPTEMLALRSEIHGIHEVALLIARRGDAALAQRAADLLETSRKDLYRLLSE